MAIGPFTTYAPPGCDPPLIYVVNWPTGEYAPARAHDFRPMNEERVWRCKWCGMTVHAHSLNDNTMKWLEKWYGVMETCADTVTNLVMRA